MHIVVKAVDVGSVEAIVMVATNKDFVAIWYVAEPIEKVNRLLFATDHAKITGVYHYISFRQIPQPVVATVSIRQMKDFHALFCLQR